MAVACLDWEAMGKYYGERFIAYIFLEQVKQYEIQNPQKGKPSLIIIKFEDKKTVL
jgi:hypothetical protein